LLGPRHPSRGGLIHLDGFDDGPAVVTSANGSRTVYTDFLTVADSERGDRHWTIMTQGNERRVLSLNLPEIGKSVAFAPLTKAERELLSKAGQIRTLPVILAKR
jgi:hypothetical protein